MKRIAAFILFIGVLDSISAQSTLTLDSCRALALSNNKELRISAEKITAAHYEKKAAFTNYLPKIAAIGTYMRTQKEISLLSDEQKGGVNYVNCLLQHPDVFILYTTFHTQIDLCLIRCQIRTDRE